MRRLTAKPMSRVRRPAYPTKLQALADPNLLAKHVPHAWLSRAEIAGSLGAFLAANAAGCSDKPPAPGSGKPDPRLEKAAIVAPIFEHGEGRGVDGCVVLSPPVFLSEEEAVKIITEELSAMGFGAPDRDVTLNGVTIPARRWRPAYDWISGASGELVRELPHVTKPLIAHLEDASRHVAVAYVSQWRYCELGGVLRGRTAEDYDFKEVAQFVAGKVEKQGRGVYFGAFYDPTTMPKCDWENQSFNYKTAHQEAQTESKRLLRQQVKDFIDWLKAQGVI
jgi:hypothetical protein